MASWIENFQMLVSARKQFVGKCIVAGSALVMTRWLWQRLRLQRFRQVPGGLPWIGNRDLLDPNRTAEIMEGWAKEHGEDGIFECSLAGQRMIVFCDYEKCLPLLSLRPFKVTRASASKQVGLIHKIQGLLFMEGSQWKLQRRLAAPAFNLKSVESYMPDIHTIMCTFLAEINKRTVAGELTNVSVLARSFNADTISKLAFGQDFGSLSHCSADLSELMVLLESINTRFVSPVPYWLFPGLGNYIDGGEAALEHMRRKMAALLDNKSELGSAMFLQKLLEVEGEKLTREELMGNLIVFFIAGTDTSTHTLSWALYHLAHRPELQDVLVVESAKLPDGVPTAQQVKALTMAQAVWKETLRLNSVVPFIDLMNEEPIILHGREIPRHTTLFVLTRTMCRTSPVVREALGDDLEEFRPARWVDSRGDLIKCTPFDTLFFGHGARRCPGMELANIVGPWVLAEIVRRFSIAQWEGPPMQEKTSFVQQPKDDVQLRFRRRSP